MFIGHEIHHISQTDSTMIYCKNLAKSGGVHGTVVSADFQTTGRGRFLRKWVSSNSENLLLSILLKPDIKEEIMGSAEVQAIFKVSKIGKVAGSKVIEGEIANNLNARLIRDGNVLYTGSIGSIFREKNAAKQVAAGLECGITLKDFADFKEKDVIEVYKIIEKERRI